LHCFFYKKLSLKNKKNYSHIIIYRSLYIIIYNLFNYFLCFFIIIFTVTISNFTKERRIYEHILYIIIYVYICLCIFIFLYKKFFTGCYFKCYLNEKYFKSLYSQYIKTKKFTVKNKILFSFCLNDLHAE